MSFLGGAMETFLNQPGLNSTESNSNHSDQDIFINSTSFASTTMSKKSDDIIHLRNLRLMAVIGEDAWDRPNVFQPIILSLQLYMERIFAGVSDDIKDTFSYSQMSKQVVETVHERPFDNIDHVAWSVGRLFHKWPGNVVQLKVEAPKSILRVQGGMQKLCVWYRKSTAPERLFAAHAWVIDGLQIACIIGVNPHERLQKQIVSINLQFDGETETAACRKQMDRSHFIWRDTVKHICKLVEDSSCHTVEALATLIAKYALEQLPIPRIGVNVEKPSALVYVESAGVSIWRDQDWFQSLTPKNLTPKNVSPKNTTPKNVSPK